MSEQNVQVDYNSTKNLLTVSKDGNKIIQLHNFIPSEDVLDAANFSDFKGYYFSYLRQEIIDSADFIGDGILSIDSFLSENNLI